MPRGYDRPLYILPFDHRGSFQTKMFGWQSPLSDAQTAEIAGAKRVIYDGFLAALAGGVPREKAGILVDEQFGAAILRDAESQNIVTACPVEKSGQAEFDFEYGEDFASHIEAFDPTFAKVLVRYNPDGDRALNKRQAARLKRLSDFLAARVAKTIGKLCRGSLDLQSAARFSGIRWSRGGANERRATRPLTRSPDAIVSLWICSSGKKMQARHPLPRRA
jgi:Uncharacterized protein conserved in bacteria (DUF2090)